MSELSKCPQSDPASTCQGRLICICPDCGREWPSDPEPEEVYDGTGIIDCNGNVLADGDTVAVIKDLKVKLRPL